MMIMDASHKEHGFRSIRTVMVALVLLFPVAACDGGNGKQADGDAPDEGDRIDFADGEAMPDMPVDAVPVEDIRIEDAGDEEGPPPPAGPLRAHPDNPRYFVDASGKTVRLAGHQIFVDLQDNSFNKATIYGGATTLDWNWYLDFARERGLNFLRNWIIWSYGSGEMADDRGAVATPMIYARTGPGTALDGNPAFDLAVYDEAFFQRLHDRLAQAGERGIYVSVMLFEVYGFGDGEEVDGFSLWDGNMLHGPNNVQGVDMDPDGNGWGIEFFYTTDEDILEMQRDYVRKVIDSVNDLDNVIYEIANELHAPEWQIAMIDLIKTYEAGKPKQHLVLMSPGGRNETGGWTLMPKSTLTDSDADVFAVAEGWGGYEDPPVETAGMPVFWDNDHVWVAGWDHHRMPWMVFTRGYHYTLYDAPFESPDQESAEWELIRFNIGATVSYGERAADLAAMEPRGDLSSTGYCLADPGTDYIVYQPSSSAEFTVTLEAGSYAYEWYDPGSVRVAETGSVSSSGGSEAFTAPFEGDAVLYLHAE